ncbi:MAG TPA: phenylacetate--CoA ligase [Candidatus Lokiarchaeia archaeon]|nr:phenylacetate--CoA ligase [Candidatus Lokiarchaeia archaeon]
MADQVRYWNKEIETMPRTKLQDLQVRRFKELIKRCYTKVKHYKEKFDELGITPDDFQTLDDLSKFPITVKTDLRDNYPFGMFAEPLSNIVRIHASSGTTGKPTVVGYTKHDIDDVWTECMARGLVAGGVKKGDVVQNAYGYGLFTGGLGFHYGCERVGASVIPISGGNTDRQVMLFQDFGSTVLTCTPSFAAYLGELIKQQNVDPSQIKLHTGIFGAEFWTENMREKLETLFSGLNESGTFRALDVYGLSEIAGPGVSNDCIFKHGLHVWEDHFFPEIIDSSTHEAVAPGESGELVFSTITKEGIPLIRYDTKDISSLEYEKCECGRTCVRHAKITGRTDDMMKIKGINVFPSQIEFVLMKIPGVAEHYEIVVERDILDKIKVRVELTPETFSDQMSELEGLKSTIEKEMYNTLQINVNVELVPPNTIPRSVGKAKRVIDLRTET